MTEKSIKFIDKFVIRAILYLLSPFFKKQREFKYLDFNSYNSFLVIRPGGIGDAVLLLPLLRFLKNKNKQVDILCMKRNSGIIKIFQKEGVVRNLYLLEKFSSVANCRANKYDCIVDTEQSFSASILLAKMISAKVIVGFVSPLRLIYYNSFVIYYQERYEARCFLDLLKVFNINVDLDNNDLNIDQNIKSSISLPPGRIVTLFTGASMPWRKPSLEFFIQIISDLSILFDAIIIIGGKGEAIDAKELAKVSNKVHDYTGKCSIDDSLYILKNSKVFISTDSGPLHMGLLASTSVIFGIFGPGIYQKWCHQGKMILVSSNFPWNPVSYGRFSQPIWHPFVKDHFNKIDSKEIISKIKNHERNTI